MWFDSSIVHYIMYVKFYQFLSRFISIFVENHQNVADVRISPNPPPTSAFNTPSPIFADVFTKVIIFFKTFLTANNIKLKTFLCMAISQKYTHANWTRTLVILNRTLAVLKTIFGAILTVFYLYSEQLSRPRFALNRFFKFHTVFCFSVVQHMQNPPQLIS